MRAGLAGVAIGLCTVSVRAQVQIPSDYVLPVSAANTSQPGFIWNVFQNEANQVTSNARAESALAGELIDPNTEAPLENYANPDEVGGADGPGTFLGDPFASTLQFVVSSIINFNQDFTSAGNIPDDLGIPGVPGITGSTDGIAGEALAWLQLPAGDHTLIVNSDDGFRLSIGGLNPRDAFATVVGEFDDGRGAADTVINIRVEEEGLYPMRLLWEEGGGGASLEFVQQLPNGTRVAVNSDEATIKAWRSVSGAPGAYARKVTPRAGATGVPYDASIEVELSGSAVQADSITLSLDGTEVDADVQRNGDVTIVSYQPENRFDRLSRHTVTLQFNDGGAERSVSWDFTVTDYALLTADMSVTPDESRPGFIWRIHQNSAFQQNDKTRPERQLAGLLGVNNADPAQYSIAIGEGRPGPTPNHPIEFEIPSTINFEQDGGSAGEFMPDDFMPGIPGPNDASPTDGIAAEIITYIRLTPGEHTLIVNSDDGFHTTAGNVRDVFEAQLAGEYVGGRGAADTAYRVIVEDEGVYPFRTVWYEGNGGASIEWKSETSGGVRALLNDTANGGLATFRAVTGPLPTAVTSVSPMPGDTVVMPEASIEITIEEGADPVDLESIRLVLDGSEVEPEISRDGDIVTISFDPPEDFVSPSTHTARITFAAGRERVGEWSFSVPPLTRDVVAGRPGLIHGAAQFTPDGGGRSGEPGDYAIDFGTANGNYVEVPDMTFLNEHTEDDDLTVTHWQKLHEVVNSSAYWIFSPSSNNNQRGWQVHTPWGDATIYFDTSGCCTTDSTRINLNIAEFSEYTGDASWWQDWHHFAFVKRNDGTKEIWIDGILFHLGYGDPLMTDFNRMYIGAESPTANTIHGIVDDLAIFDSALTEAQITQLANGASPGQISGAGLIAHWDFNDAPSGGGGGGGDEISITRDGTSVQITFSGTLQEANSVTGPWQDVPGATSPVTIPAGEEQKFYRSRE